MHGTVGIKLRNALNGLREYWNGQDGAGYVIPGTAYNGEFVAGGGDVIVGAAKLAVMLPDDATPDPAAANEVWTDAVGISAAWFQVREQIPTDQPLLVAASSIASDGVNLGALLDLADAEISAAAPTGAVLDGVIALTQYDIEKRVLMWDGTNPIRTIAMRWAYTGGGAADETIAVIMNMSQGV